MSNHEWDHFQEDITTWQKKVMPSHERTPQRAFTRALEEVAELSEAVTIYDGSNSAKQEVGLEATDVMIQMLGIIAIVGGNAAELLEKKIGTMQKKYPADIINRQVQSGMPYEKVMRSHKEAWQGNGARIIPLFKS